MGGDMTPFYVAYKALFAEAEQILKHPLENQTSIYLAVEGLEHARRTLVDARDDDERPPLLRHIQQERESHGSGR